LIKYLPKIDDEIMSKLLTTDYNLKELLDYLKNNNYELYIYISCFLSHCKEDRNLDDIVLQEISVGFCDILYLISLQIEKNSILPGLN
jgi:hypothetical protein